MNSTYRPRATNIEPIGSGDIATIHLTNTLGFGAEIIEDVEIIKLTGGGVHFAAYNIGEPIGDMDWKTFFIPWHLVEYIERF